MNYYEIQRDATSQMVEFDVFDSSSSVGARLAGLVYNTASLTAYYNRQNAAGAATAISLVTMTKGTWVSGGFVAVDGTNMPGVYQLCLPDAAVAAAAGVNFVTVVIKGAANMVPVVLNIRLTNWVASTTPANTLTVASNKVGATVAAGDIANDAITAAAIANGAIDNATFAADVGSTAYATNILALAADKAVVNAALATAAELAKVPKSDGTVSFNATALAAVADKALGRAVAGGADGGRTVSQALQALRNKVAITAGTMTVYAADDSTPSWTAAVTTDAAAVPIVTVDPA